MFDVAMFEDAGLLLAMAIALVAGLLSFLSPCVLPVVPPYLAYMGGTTVTDLSEAREARRSALRSAMMFVLGLSTVFIILGYGSGLFGGALIRYGNWLVMGSGIVIMIFGAHFLGIFRFGFMDREARFEAGDRGGSTMGAYILGLAFAFGWTPCLGPILGSILGIAASEADAAKGAVLLGAYAIGLGVPFLLVAAYFPSMQGLMAFFKRHMDRIERISGLLLWTVGLMMLTGQFTDFAYWLQSLPFLSALG